MRISDRSSDVCSSDLMTISMDLAPQLRASGATSLATVAASTAQTEGREPHYMVVLYTVWYNFLRMHKTLKMTPAMAAGVRSEEHTSELQSLMRISYAVFCLKKKNNNTTKNSNVQPQQKH